MTTSSTPEGTVAECKRRVDECNALLKNTIAPEYRHALIAMAKAWMKIAHIEEQNQRAATDGRLRSSFVRVESQAK
jgi:hypothetical protein